MDFDINRVGEQLIIDEFNGKYAGSYLYINDILVKVFGVEQNGTINCQKQTLIPETIRNFSPEVGLYSQGDSLVFLKRLCDRQFIKSFKIGNTYTYVYLVNSLMGIKPETMKYLGICAVFQNKVFLYDTQIGIEDQHTIYLFPKYFHHFRQDIKELCPNYNITSISSYNPHQQSIVTKKPANKLSKKPVFQQKIIVDEIPHF